MQALMAGAGARGEAIANGHARSAAVGSVCRGVGVSFAEFAAEVPEMKSGWDAVLARVIG